MTRMAGLDEYSYRVRSTSTYRVGMEDALETLKWSEWMDMIVPPAVAELLDTPRVVSVRLTFEQGEAEYRKTINIGDHGNA